MPRAQRSRTASPRTASPRTITWLVILGLLAPGGLLRPGRAAAEVAIKTILLDSLYGGATGLLLGGVLTLVLAEENRDDSVRWGVVLGTFAGFGYGVYETHGSAEEYAALAPERSRPSATAATGALRPAFAAWADSRDAQRKLASPEGDTRGAGPARDAWRNEAAGTSGTTSRPPQGRISW